MNFPEKIRNLRNKNALSQEELAEKLAVSRQTISKWEAGNSFPEIEKLISLSSIFQVSIDYLLKDNQININCSEDLDRMIIQFLGSSYEMAEISHQLVDIMQDGIIDDSERVQMENIIQTLDKISENIKRIRKAIHLNYSLDPKEYEFF